MKILFYVIIALQLLTLFSCANEQLVGHWEQDKNSIHLYNGEILTINHAIFKKEVLESCGQFSRKILHQVLVRLI